MKPASEYVDDVAWTTGYDEQFIVVDEEDCIKLIIDARNEALEEAVRIAKSVCADWDGCPTTIDLCLEQFEQLKEQNK